MTEDGATSKRWLSRAAPRVVGGVALVAVLVGAAWYALTRPVPVRTVRAQRGELVAEAFGTGTLESKVVAAVSSKIVGRVEAVLVDQGDTVTAGQTLARLEARDFRDAVRVAVAQRDQAAATLAKAKVDFDRQQELVGKRLVAQVDFDVAETAQRVAEAQLKSAEAALGVAEAKLADTTVASPAPGLVITRNLEIGSTVVPGAPIFRIATSVPWVVAQVDERATGSLRPGQAARVLFQTTPSLELPGHVARLSAEADRVTEEREVDVTLDRLPENRFLGQRADVYLETSRKSDAVRLPSAVVVVLGGQSGVFAIVDGRASWRPVQLGLRGRKMVEAVNGVSDQDVLIVNPLAGKSPVADGMRVVAAPEKSGP